MEKALAIDQVNRNNIWKKAIKNIIKGLYNLNVFKFVNSNLEFDKKDKWQKALLIIIFTVKAKLENDSYKYTARYIVGGHKLNFFEYNIYSSTVKSLIVKLLLMIAGYMRLFTMTANIANVFYIALN